MNAVNAMHACWWDRAGLSRAGRQQQPAAAVDQAASGRPARPLHPTLFPDPFMLSSCFAANAAHAAGAAGNTQDDWELEYGAQDFFGVVDEMRVWRRARTGDQVRLPSKLTEGCDFSESLVGRTTALPPYLEPPCCLRHRGTGSCPPISPALPLPLSADSRRHAQQPVPQGDDGGAV